MNYKTILLITCCVLLLACKNTTNNNLTNNSEPENIGDLIEEEPLITSIIKISESAYITPNDTIVLEKPFFKTFEGEIDGRKVQAYVSQSMMSEYHRYEVAGGIYIEGDSSFTYIGLEQVAPGKWRTPQNEWAQEQPYQYEFSLQGPLIVIKDEYRYPLQAGEVQYQAYDVFNYRMNYCYFDGTFYKPHWEYDFQAVPVQYPEKYASFFQQNPLSQIEKIYYSPDYQKWKHNIELDINEGSDDGDDCYTTFSQGFLTPYYLDSCFYVVSHFHHIYMGGAHGLPGTTYFNFDVKTGKLLHLEDILQVDDDQFTAFYMERLKQTFQAENGEIPFLQEPQGASENFSLLPTGITFSYYPYELMGFAAGEPSLFLSWDELTPYLIK